jgi:LysM repeat protein
VTITEPVTTTEQLTTTELAGPVEPSAPPPGAKGASDEGGCTESYVVQPGESLTVIARRYGLAYGDLVRANDLANPNFVRSGQVLCIPTGAQPSGEAPVTYTVQPGDTLTSIARQFGVSLRSLMDANEIANANLIRVGRVLRIPEE